MQLSEGRMFADSDHVSRSTLIKILFNEMPTPSTPPAPAGPPKPPAFEEGIIDCPRRPWPTLPPRLPWTPVIPKRPPILH